MNLRQKQFILNDPPRLLDYFRQKAVEKIQCKYTVSYKEHILQSGTASSIKKACHLANETVEAFRTKRIYEVLLFVKIERV